jgi:hypothetical protein
MKSLKSLAKKTTLLIVILISMLAFKGEKDALHKRIFNISLSETKNDVVAKKVIADQLTFKDGKLFSDYLSEKFGYKWMRYRINKDSIFMDSTETEVRMLEVESSATNEDNQTVTINFVTQEWDIDGTIKITKNDKLKKHFDFAGREKGGKPKKDKKKKTKKIIEVVEPGMEPQSPQGRQEVIEPKKE